MIQSGDIFFRLSGGASNQAASLSLGGAMSFMYISSGVMQNLFPNVTPAQTTAGYTDHICFYVFNDNNNDTMFDVEIGVSVVPDSPNTTIEIGLDPSGPNGTATTTASPTTVPTGVTFSSPALPGLNMGNLAPQGWAALWVKRIVTAGASVLQEDNFELAVIAQET